MWKSDLPKPPIGSFENCARCEKQFTVVSTLISFVSSYLTTRALDEVYLSCKPSTRLVVPYMRQVFWC